MSKTAITFISEKMWANVQKVGNIVYDQEYMCQFSRDEKGVVWYLPNPGSPETEAFEFEAFIDGIRGAIEYLIEFRHDCQQSRF